MSIFDRIVCGVDGTEAGLAALDRAMRLLTPGGRLLALTVCDLSIAAQAGWAAGNVATELERGAAAASAEAERRLGGLPGADARLVEGSPVGRLMDAIGRERATLVAVGSHGSSRAAGIVLGSVATALLHEAPGPVLVARPADRDAFPSSIVAGVDGSAASLAAAAAAEELAARFGASLRLVTSTGGKPVDVEGLLKLRAVEPEPAAGRLGGATVLSRTPILAWTDRPPLEALLEAASDADLLVVGSRGLHGVGALGSVSERVAHRASCSVLVVRPSA